MVELEELRYLSQNTSEWIKITDDVRKIVERSSITEGLCTVLVSHTTAGIVVNEGLSCVEDDLSYMLDTVAPKDRDYYHAHFLSSYGATGNNSQGHLKSTLVGNSCQFVIHQGKLWAGAAQDIYLAEFDGPQARKVLVHLIGE